MAGREVSARAAGIGPATETHRTEAERIFAKLKDPDALFTTAEVAYLMSVGGRWGYECKTDEVNAEYPPEPVFVRGQWWDQAEERQKADAEVRRLVAEERGQ